MIGREIKLTNREMAMGADCGVMRHIESISSGRRDAHGLDNEFGWNLHIEGACGEIAAAKCMNRFWTPSIRTFKAPDLGSDIQVRTRSRIDYELVMRPADDPSHFFVLVNGQAPNFIVRGYLRGSEIMKDEWMRGYGGRPPAWFAPHLALRDIGELIII